MQKIYKYSYKALIFTYYIICYFSSNLPLQLVQMSSNTEKKNFSKTNFKFSIDNIKNNVELLKNLMEELCEDKTRKQGLKL